MKKLLAILALTAAGIAQAGSSATVEFQNADNVGSTNQNIFVLSAKQDLNSNFAADVAFSNTQTEDKNTLSTRLESGITASAPIYGSVKGYVRTALGEKYSNTNRFAFYSVEPGVTAPVGPFTAKVGFRFRDAVDNGDFKDQTRTVRTTLTYPLTANDAVSVRYDRVYGDANQKILVAAYTRSF